MFGKLGSLANERYNDWKNAVQRMKDHENSDEHRWSARADACRSLCCSWNELMAALQIIANDANEKPSTRSEASGLLNSLYSMETCFLSLLWNDILEKFNKSKAIEKSGENSYAYDMQRKRKRKVQFDEVKGNETELSGRDRFRVTIFNVIIDRLITELWRRGSAYEELSKKFNFLTKLHHLESKDIRESARNLITFYPGDLDRTLENECLHLQAHLLSNNERPDGGGPKCQVPRGPGSLSPALIVTMEFNSLDFYESIDFQTTWWGAACGRHANGQHANGRHFQKMHIWSTPKWSTRIWSTRKWSTPTWSTCHGAHPVDTHIVDTQIVDMQMVDTFDLLTYNAQIKLILPYLLPHNSCRLVASYSVELERYAALRRQSMVHCLFGTAKRPLRPPHSCFLTRNLLCGET
uniref:Uncharacterized protein n=1 Tax=Strigamia maritima TaxID=126957 RepID=T1IKZ5_STRMM